MYRNESDTSDFEMESNLISSSDSEDDNRYGRTSVRDYYLKNVTNIRNDRRFAESSSDCYDSDSSDGVSDDPWWVTKKKNDKLLQDVPYSISRYVPCLTVYLFNELSRRCYLRTSIMVTINSFRVNRLFCKCSKGPMSVGIARRHLDDTLSECRRRLTKRRFIGFVFSLMYAIMLKNVPVFPQDSNPYQKHTCKNCTLFNWWLAVFDNDAGKMGVYIYKKYLVSIRSRYPSQDLLCIDRLMQQKHTVIFIKCQMDIFKEYAGFKKVQFVLFNIVYALITNGSKLCKSRTILDLYLMCKKHVMFKKVVSILDAGLTPSAKRVLSLKEIIIVRMLQKCPDELAELPINFIVDLSWNNQKALAEFSRLFNVSLRNPYYRLQFFSTTL
ncbi:ORF41 [Betabaculovirus altermyunipunctae]|uniref:ORF41 n=1 Tax=Betabaculovirus altermyunipunctae TaxID=3051996 RepID=A0A1S5YEC7_9BBAC|nr:ORF41 [Betabaculovirus altermyunipunctae]AQQ80308.1 ORF41 [Betabaculovirus altermyunipunctae]